MKANRVLMGLMALSSFTVAATASILGAPAPVFYALLSSSVLAAVRGGAGEDHNDRELVSPLAPIHQPGYRAYRAEKMENTAQPEMNRLLLNSLFANDLESFKDWLRLGAKGIYRHRENTLLGFSSSVYHLIAERGELEFAKELARYFPNVWKKPDPRYVPWITVALKNRKNSSAKNALFLGQMIGQQEINLPDLLERGQACQKDERGFGPMDYLWTEDNGYFLSRYFLQLKAGKTPFQYLQSLSLLFEQMRHHGTAISSVTFLALQTEVGNLLETIDPEVFAENALEIRLFTQLLDVLAFDIAEAVGDLNQLSLSYLDRYPGIVIEAIDRGHEGVLSFLKEKKLTTVPGYYPTKNLLEAAFSRGAIESLRYFLAQPVHQLTKHQVKDEMGRNLVFQAINSWPTNRPMLNLLLAEGISPDVADHSGQTARQRAEELGLAHWLSAYPAPPPKEKPRSLTQESSGNMASYVVGFATTVVLFFSIRRFLSSSRNFLVKLREVTSSKIQTPQVDQDPTPAPVRERKRKPQPPKADQTRRLPSIAKLPTPIQALQAVKVSFQKQSLEEQLDALITHFNALKALPIADRDPDQAEGGRAHYVSTEIKSLVEVSSAKLNENLNAQYAISNLTHLKRRFKNPARYPKLPAQAEAIIRQASACVDHIESEIQAKNWHLVYETAFPNQLKFGAVSFLTPENTDRKARVMPVPALEPTPAIEPEPTPLPAPPILAVQVPEPAPAIALDVSAPQAKGIEEDSEPGIAAGPGAATASRVSLVVAPWRRSLVAGTRPLHEVSSAGNLARQYSRLYNAYYTAMQHIVQGENRAFHWQLRHAFAHMPVFDQLSPETVESWTSHCGKVKAEDDRLPSFIVDQLRQKGLSRHYAIADRLRESLEQRANPVEPTFLVAFTSEQLKEKIQNRVEWLKRLSMDVVDQDPTQVNQAIIFITAELGELLNHSQRRGYAPGTRGLRERLIQFRHDFFHQDLEPEALTLAAIGNSRERCGPVQATELALAFVTQAEFSPSDTVSVVPEH